jgi:adenosylcobinamide-phosphate synthase
VTALATWAVVGGTSLRREANEMTRLLEGGDLDGARQRLSHLCGRDPASSMPRGSRAPPWSPSPRTPPTPSSDRSSGAPIGGVPGLLAYRAVNTLDAMVGHRSPRYERFGWAAARADDVANLLPSRVSAYLASGFAPVVGGRAALRCASGSATGHKHPSPERRPVEAAFAGALCRTLGGRLSYAGASRTGRCSVTARRPACTTSPAPHGCPVP